MEDTGRDPCLNINNDDSKHNSAGRQHGITPSLMLGITVVTLGCSLPGGHNIGVLNSPQEIIREWVQLTFIDRYGVELKTSEEVIVWAVIVSLFVAGATCGSMMGGPLADATGRCRAILITLLLNLLASILFICCKLAGSVEMLIIGRLLCGITTGLSTSLVPLYLSEVAPTTFKGVMGVLFPFGLCSGVLISQIFGLDALMGTQTLWPFLVGIFGLYVIVSLILYPSIPESPAYYFLVVGDDDRGRKELQRLRADQSNLVEEEMLIKDTAPKASADNSSEPSNQWTAKKVFECKELRFPLLLAVMLNATQQLSGINAVFYYSDIIFRSSGLNNSQSQIATICAGILNLLMSVIAIPLIRYCRRRHLLLFSIAFSIVSQVILMVGLYLIPTTQNAGFVAIAALLGYVVAYGAGLGPVPYMIATELFPVGPRSIGLAMGGAANWGSNLLVGLLFPSLQHAARECSFIVFITICFLTGTFFYRYLPETSMKDDPSPSDSDNILSSEEDKSLLKTPNKEPKIV